MNEALRKLLESELAERSYYVGGCVRDLALGIESNDIDIVVAATQEEFEKVFPDAKFVGKDFPVYVISGMDIALTRTERSTGHGYGSFEVTNVGVTIEEDLGRRDFTINAIAKKITDGKIIDPFGGLKDIENKLIKKVFDNTFAEDPVRILRAARIANRLGFAITADTLDAMRENADELQHMTKERIVLEIEKLHKSTNYPSYFFKILAHVGALKYIFPELGALRFVPAGPTGRHGDDSAFDHTMKCIDKASKEPFHVFIGVLFHDLGKATTPEDMLPHHFQHESRSRELVEKMLGQHRFPKMVNEFAPMFAQLHMKAHYITEANAKKHVKLFKEVGKRYFEDYVRAANCDSELSNEQIDIFAAMKRVQHTKMSFLAEIPPALRAQRAHEFLVSTMKRELRQLKERD